MAREEPPKASLAMFMAHWLQWASRGGASLAGGLATAAAPSLPAALQHNHCQFNVPIMAHAIQAQAKQGQALCSSHASQQDLATSAVGKDYGSMCTVLKDCTLSGNVLPCSETEADRRKKKINPRKATEGVRGPYTGGASGSRKLAPAICACCTSTSVTSKNLFCEPCSVRTSLCQTEDHNLNLKQ